MPFRPARITGRQPELPRRRPTVKVRGSRAAFADCGTCRKLGYCYFTTTDSVAAVILTFESPHGIVSVRVAGRNEKEPPNGDGLSRMLLPLVLFIAELDAAIIKAAGRLVRAARL